MNASLLRSFLFGAFVSVVALLTLAATGVVHWARPGVFRVILAGIVVLNLAWWLRADLRIRTAAGTARARRWARGGLAVYMTAVLLPLAWMIQGSLNWHHMPTATVMWVQMWHMLIVLVVPIGAVLATCGWFLAQGFGRRAGADGSASQVDRSRRALLQKALVVAPMTLVGAGLAAGYLQKGRILKRRLSVRPPGLPDRLRGLTITHLSDFHVGRLVQADDVRRAVDQANRLDSDIVVVTGDIVDHSNEVLPETIDALKGLRSRYGLYLVLGNHDLIDDGEALVDFVRGAGLSLLLNERRDVRIGGERLVIGGLMWARRDHGSAWFPGHEEQARATFGSEEEASPDAFRIALVHHPHAFDALARRKVALTLSGHTHGGQLMLTPPGYPEWGAGSLLFRYIRGFYTGSGRPQAVRGVPDREVVRSDEPVLFVNSGVGNWFPVRVNAPAEIVQLRLC